MDLCLAADIRIGADCRTKPCTCWFRCCLEVDGVSIEVNCRTARRCQRLSDVWKTHISGAASCSSHAGVKEEHPGGVLSVVVWVEDTTLRLGNAQPDKSSLLCSTREPVFGHLPHGGLVNGRGRFSPQEVIAVAS